MNELKPDIIIACLTERLNELTELKKTCERKLRYAPTGFIRALKYRSDYQYYLRTDPADSCGKYIKKKDMNIVSEIVNRDYYLALYKETDEEITLLKRFLNSYHPDTAISLYSDLSEARKRFISPIILPDSDYIQNFLSQKYESLGFTENDAEFYTSFGLRVRSKSEILIAEALHRNNIPFLYEYPLFLKGLGIVHPDFYCLNIRRREIFPWEHLGMLDNELYANRNTGKIEKYILNNYIPGKNLILSFETSSHPINAQTIDKMISSYLV